MPDDIVTVLIGIKITHLSKLKIINFAINQI